MMCRPVDQPIPLSPPRGLRSALALVFLAVVVSPANCGIAVAEELFPDFLVKFAPSKDGPVFTAAGPGHWDERIRERGWILRDADGWHLWYTGFDGTREGRKLLGYATSKDGLAWKRYPGNPIYTDHWVEDMMVVRVGDTDYMFAEGLNDRAQLLTSTDHVHWKRRGTLAISKVDGMPIDDGPYGTPTAWYENGQWWLFYERRDAGIWVAKPTSKDLTEWKNVQDEPVLSPGPQKFDHKYVAFNQILKFGDRYYAYYHGSAADTKPSLWASGVAVSTDLIHWKKYSGNPLRPIAENKSSGILVNDGEKWRFYTMHHQVEAHFPEKR